MAQVAGNAAGLKGRHPTDDALVVRALVQKQKKAIKYFAHATQVTMPVLFHGIECLFHKNDYLFRSKNTGKLTWTISEPSTIV